MQHNITDGTQFQELEERFNEKIDATHQELRSLDERLARYHKIEGALLSLEQTPENSLSALQLLEEFRVPKDMSLEDVTQLLQQFEVEKDALQEFFDDTLKTYTTYQEIKETVRSRETKTQETEKSL